MNNFNPSKAIFAIQNTDQNRGVNVSISDSATFYFPTAQDMEATFNGEVEAFLYSRHSNSTNQALSNALAAMEDTEAGIVTGSGMAAITTVILHLCNSGDHLITSHTVYGGSFAFMKNWLKKVNIDVTFVDIINLDEVKAAVKPNTKMIYTETMANPLLNIADLPALADIAHSNNAKLVVDNTFTPMIVTPKHHGADIIIYSLTKFVNGKNDMVGGAILCSKEMFMDLLDLNHGTAMLLGPVMDSLRSSMVLKNLYTLHIRMQQHSKNAIFIAKKLKEKGIKVCYPGLESDKNYKLITTLMNKGYGYGGMIAMDLGTYEKGAEFLKILQEKGVGYLAVSLGYFKTLFSNSGHSTSSEVPTELQEKIGIKPGLTRFSVGLDDDIEATWAEIENTLKEIKLI
ncbi:MAG: aminotransferase class I/II-fold pyridoxal phosphate-dependent enzyme [Bacteroidales bacterium]|nr:aminotransferase class I/II-fold pyridoxal phosphate-dependent enzyme [Bacteroidales bacterium]